jgi:hypothetical protein
MFFSFRFLLVDIVGEEVEGGGVGIRLEIDCMVCCLGSSFIDFGLFLLGKKSLLPSFCGRRFCGGIATTGFDKNGFPLWRIVSSIGFSSSSSSLLSNEITSLPS